MSNYYPPGAFRALCEIWDREAEAEALAAAVEEMVSEAKRDRARWFAEIVIEYIDKAPQRVYSLFDELVQAAVPSNPPYAYPEEDWPELVEQYPNAEFLRSIPFICYELAEAIAYPAWKCALPADDNERHEAREWLKKVDTAIDAHAEKAVRAEWEAAKEEAEIERGLASRESEFLY